MHLTERQKVLLNSLDQIKVRQKRSGYQGYFLAGKDYTATIYSLIVKGLLERSPDQRRLLETNSARTLLARSSRMNDLRCSGWPQDERRFSVEPVSSQKGRD
jgi:hypothetical protein